MRIDVGIAFFPQPASDLFDVRRFHGELKGALDQTWRSIIKKLDAGRNDGRPASTAMKTVSLSARDPLAYAATLKDLG